MRRISCDDPFDRDESPRRSRVVRLVDLVEEGDGRERRVASPSVSETEGSEPRRKARQSRPATPKALGEDPREAFAASAVLSVAPEGDGDTVAVSLALSPRDGEPKPRRVTIRLLVEQYAALRAEGISLECGDISEEHAALLTEAGALCEAIRLGTAALQYGDRSAYRLIVSLTAKGISRETAEAAVAYLARKGYVRDEETARRRARADLRKGWGPRRIREDLRALGLDSEVVNAAMEELSEVDFSEICAEVIRKKYGGLPDERPERGDRQDCQRRQNRQKMIAALMRLGYDADHIRGAMRLLAGERV